VHMPEQRGQLSVRLGPLTMRSLDDLADERGLSRSELVRRLIEDAAAGRQPLSKAGLPLPDEEELVGMLGVQARRGSVSAIRALLQREAQADPRQAALAAIARLAAQRVKDDDVAG
jgi:hypothetical protein